MLKRIILLLQKTEGGSTLVLDDSNSFILPRAIFTKTKALRENNFKIFLFYNYIYYIAYTNYLDGITINKILLKKLTEYFDIFNLNREEFISNKDLLDYIIPKHTNIHITGCNDHYFEFEVKDFNTDHIRFPDLLANPDSLKLLKNIIDFNFRTRADRLIVIYKLLELLYDNNKDWNLHNSISNNLAVQLKEKIKSFKLHNSKNTIHQLLNKNFLIKNQNDYYINYPFIIPDYRDILAGKAAEHIWLLVHKYPKRYVKKLKKEKLDLYQLIREFKCKMYNGRPFLYLNNTILDKFINIYRSYPEEDKSVKIEKLLSSIKYHNIIKPLKTCENHKEKGAVSKKFNLRIPAKNDFSDKIIDLIKESYPLARDLKAIKPGLPYYELNDDQIDYFIQIVNNKENLTEEKKDYLTGILNKLRKNKPFLENYLKNFPTKICRQIIDHSIKSSQIFHTVTIRPDEGGYEIAFPAINNPSDISFFENLGAIITNGSVIKILSYDIVELTKVYSRRYNTASQYRNYYFFRELFNDDYEESFIWYEIGNKQKTKNKLNALAEQRNNPVIGELYNLIKGPFLNKDDLKEKLYEYITDEEDIKNILSIASNKNPVMMAETGKNWFLNNGTLCYSGKNLLEKITKKIYKNICKLNLKPFDVYFLIEVFNKNKILPDNSAIKFKIAPFNIIKSHGTDLENRNNYLIFNSYRKDFTDKDLIDFISLDYQKLKEPVEIEIRLVPPENININNLLEEINRNFSVQFRFFVNYCKKPHLMNFNQ